MSFTRQFLRTRHLVLVAAAVLLLVAPLWDAYAYSGAGPSTFSAVQLSPHENGGSDPEANLPALFAVYIITWGGFFAFVFVMSRRQREMRREIDALKAALEERAQTAGGE